MTDLQLVQELAGKTCHCGKPKQRGHTFCRFCYFRLPPQLGQALYKRLGYGYREAYEAAVDYLTIDTETRAIAQEKE